MHQMLTATGQVPCRQGERQPRCVTLTFRLSANRHGTHDLKLGLGILYAEERSRIDTFATGLFLYATDSRAIPVAYSYGVGSSDVTLDTTRYSAFVQDDWRPNDRLTVSLGVRYAPDDGGNNPGYTHPLVTRPREKDSNDFQPRLGFSYYLRGDGGDTQSASSPSWRSSDLPLRGNRCRLLSRKRCAMRDSPTLDRRGPRKAVGHQIGWSDLEGHT